MSLTYWKKLSFPLILEVLFILSTFALPQQVFYTKLVFAAAVIIWLRKEFSLREYIEEFHYVRSFWIPVACGAAGMLVCHFIRQGLSTTVWAMKTTGMIQIFCRGLTQTTLNYVMSMLLIPLAEELLFRKAMIVLDRRKIPLMIGTAVLGAVLCSLTSMLGIIGILELLIMSVPLILVYCITENFYATLTVHFIYAIAINGMEIVYYLLRMDMR